MNRFLIFVLLLGLSISQALPSEAAAKKKKKDAVKATGAQLGTDFKLNDLTVRGKYQSSAQGLVTVENEKGLNDLLDYRRDYNDRIRQSRAHK